MTAPGDREGWLADTLVSLADTLTAAFDVVEFLSTLAERIVDLLDAAEVGLVLADPRGRLRVMASSTERMRLMDLFEVQTSEGPCLDCFRSGEAVINVDLEHAAAAWPVFTPMALQAGFRTVHALPMRWHDQVIGAANIFHATAASIDDRDRHVAQALVDVATIGILQERAVRRGTDLAEQLQRALNSRIAIEQAKGAVAERAGVDMDTAFGWLRTYARSNNMRLAVVAVAIVERALSIDALRTTPTRLPEQS
jgi:AmiR/NasT family two-component response regulator